MECIDATYASNESSPKEGVNTADGNCNETVTANMDEGSIGQTTGQNVKKNKARERSKKRKANAEEEMKSLFLRVQEAVSNHKEELARKQLEKEQQSEASNEHKDDPSQAATNPGIAAFKPQSIFSDVQHIIVSRVQSGMHFTSESIAMAKEVISLVLSFSQKFSSKQKAQLIRCMTELQLQASQKEVSATDKSDDFRQTPESDQSSCKVHFVSFGYKHGAPLNAQKTYDIRRVHNVSKGMRKVSSGLDEALSHELWNGKNSEKVNNFYQRIFQMVQRDVEKFVQERSEKSTAAQSHVIRIALGCNSGRHRSVAFVQRLISEPHWREFQPSVHIEREHRDIFKL